MTKELYTLFIQGLTEDEFKRFMDLSRTEQEQIYRMWNGWMLDSLLQDMRKTVGIV